MQPTEDAFELGELPESTGEPHLIYLVKRYEYVSLVMRPQLEDSGESTAVITVHQAEARKLAEALLKVVEAGVREDFADRVWLGTEGATLGGPPRKDQLVEFNPDL